MFKVEEKEKRRIEALAKLLIPFCIAAGFAFILFLAGPQIYIKLGAIMLTYFFTPVGRFVILGSILDIDIWMIIGSIIFVDVVSSLFIVWNFDLAAKIPFIGSLILETEEKGHEYLRRYPLVRRFAFIGITLFIAIPFAGTNAIVGTIMGRIIGMDALRLWISVIIGSFFGCTIIALPVHGINIWLG